MKKRYKLLAITLALLFVAFEYSYSFLEIKLKPIIPTNTYNTIDASEYPLFKVKVKLLRDNIEISPEIADFLIIENNTVAKPSTMTPDADGWYEMTWYTRLRGVIYDIGFIVVKGNELAQATGHHSRSDFSQVRYSDMRSDPFDEFRFGNVAAGDSLKSMARVYALSAKLNSSGEEGRVRIDSIHVTGNGTFGFDWLGSQFDSKQPPVDVYPIFSYFVNFKYYPPSKGYFRERATVYYDAGLKEEVDLIGGQFNIPTNEKVLKLVYPNGGEYFAPCQRVQLKWTGAVRTMSTDIDISYDGGYTWDYVGSSFDSTYIWTVPTTLTKTALFRVRQKFNPSNPQQMVIDKTPVNRINFSNAGAKLLSANVRGKITEWDILTQKPALPEVKYTLNMSDNEYETIVPVGICYTNDADSLFAVVYRLPGQSPIQDSIAFFEVGKPEPYLKVPIEEGFFTKKMYLDPNKKFLVIQPSFGMRLKIFSLVENKFTNDIAMPYPITALTVSTKRPEAAIALLNGDIKIVSLPDFQTQLSLDYSHLPIIVEMGLSPNGKYLAIGCNAPKATTLSGNKNQMHVINLASNQIIRSIRKTASDPVGLKFSPASTVLMLGSSAQPQITFWDLPLGEESFMGGLSGHQGNLTDFAFSPVGSSIATSSASDDNLYIRSFTYSEVDTSDNYFTIEFPKANFKTQTIPSSYIGDSRDITLSAVLCNTDSSHVPMILTDAKMMFGNHFRLKDAFPLDTLFPGDCIDMSLVYYPVDTGAISDTLIFGFCTGDYRVGINSYCKNRSITFYNNMFDFGELCLGSEEEREITLARNDDPVPLKINFIEIPDNIANNFSITSLIKDTVLQPGQSIKIKIKFAPKQLGDILNQVRILHSDQTKYFPETTIKGKGIGTNYSVSHEDLRFIPEIPLRKIAVKNDSKNDIYVESFSSVPSGWFTITSALPKTIPAGSTDSIEVYWDVSKGNPPSDVLMSVKAGPCAASKVITLGLYSGFSNLKIEDVFADPRGNAAIPVSFVNTENKPYKGIRFFEAEFTINPRMFLPETVTSTYGTGRITKNIIDGNRRVIGFRVDGDFPLQGILGTINGVAGLAETDTSRMEFLSKSLFWSKLINVNTRGGIFNLINICSNRFVTQDNIYDLSLYPNPASGSFTADFQSSVDGTCTIEIFDYLGNKLGETVKAQTKKGKNIVPLNADYLVSGYYKILIRMDLTVVSAGFNVVK